jgi:DNA-binding transcriptional ArsR family regulator
VEPEHLDAVFAALGDPTRRAILARLRSTRTVTVTEIAEPFEMTLNAISKHVKVLERAGLIRRQVIGREHHLSLQGAPMSRAARWLMDYQQFWEDRLDRMGQVLAKPRKR